MKWTLTITQEGEDSTPMFFDEEPTVYVDTPGLVEVSGHSLKSSTRRFISTQRCVMFSLVQSTDEQVLYLILQTWGERYAYEAAAVWEIEEQMERIAEMMKGDPKTGLESR